MAATPGAGSGAGAGSVGDGSDVVKEWHIHTYFNAGDRAERAAAETVRRAVVDAVAAGRLVAVCHGVTSAHLPRLSHRPPGVNEVKRGPHPCGSFETWVPAEGIAAALSLFAQLRTRVQAQLAADRGAARAGDASGAGAGGSVHDGRRGGGDKGAGSGSGSHGGVDGVAAATRDALVFLIHPLTRLEIRDHTERAAWMGGPLPLNLAVLSHDLGTAPAQYPELGLGYSTQVQAQPASSHDIKSNSPPHLMEHVD